MVGSLGHVILAVLNSVGLATVVAASAVWLAWRASRRQLEQSRLQADKDASAARELARSNDTRQRWWEAVRWYHEQRARIGEEAFLRGIEDLSAPSQVRTETQRLTLKAVIQAPLPEEGQESDVKES